jgi:hypothetical protein
LITMFNRRLEDRIRTLCAKLALAKNGEFKTLMHDLQKALAEHSLRVMNRTSAVVLAWPGFPQERRMHPD